MDKKTFRLYIRLDGAAFEPTPYREIADRLNEIAVRLRHVDAHGNYPGGGWIGHYQTIHDVNGNDVGRYAIKPTDRE